MCGRFTLTPSAAEIAEHFGLDAIPEVDARFNIAPTQDVLVVRNDAANGTRQLEFRHWGLVPRWARDRAGAAKRINARAETASEKASFRDALRTRRCLVPMDGYYEWKTEGRRKRPHLVRLGQGELFSVGGLYEHWRSPEGEVLESVTLLTQPANESLRSLHHRMPVVIAPDGYEAWLDREVLEGDVALRSVDPALGTALETRAVGDRVSNARNEGPACLDPPKEIQPSLFGEGEA